MTEMNNGAEEQSFAEMFAASEALERKSVKVGEKISGKIIHLTKDSVFIDTGTKIDGVAERDEFLDENGEFPYVEGDELELYVVGKSHSEIKLSRAMTGIGGAEMLREAFHSKVPVEGRVKDTIKGGFSVEMMHRRAFCPISQMDTRYVENAEEYVGQTLRFLITKFEQNGRNIVVSRRVLLQEEQEQAAAEFMDTLTPDAIFDGKVTRLANFGAFVEITPGVEGLVHVSEIGWSRVANPEDVLSKGESVRVKVLKVEQSAKGPRISLSIKQAGGDPWDSISGQIAIGDIVEGTVTRLAAFGAFVELIPGIEGLVHISEMSYLKRVNKPEEIVSQGQTVQVAVKDIDLEKRRIGLSLRAAEGDPWAQAADKFQPGSTVSGKVEKREQFGLFIELAPGVTGLMPKSKMSKSEDPAALDNLKPGDEIAVLVEELNISDRKATLAPADAKEVDDWKGYKPESASGGAGGLGSLGEQLQKAMAKKK